MARLALISMLAVLGCQAAPAPAKTEPAKTEPAKPEPAKPEPAKPEAPVTTADEQPRPTPPWFDPMAYEHAAIIKQDLTGARVASGQTSAMIVLELPTGTTPEQCIEQGRAKLGETIGELPDNITTPQGYLQVQGKFDGYEYTVVCGIAKDKSSSEGKPTMFLSYTQ